MDMFHILYRFYELCTVNLDGLNEKKLFFFFFVFSRCYLFSNTV